MASLLNQNFNFFEFRSAKFMFPPPRFDDYVYQYKTPNPPFKNAEPWQCSLYYFWFEYLRRHKGYKITCLANGKGKYSTLYKDFGNVHQSNFIDWWRQSFHLFQEPQAIRRIDRDKITNSSNGKIGSSKLYFEIDLTHDLKELSREFQEIAWIYKNLDSHSKCNFHSPVEVAEIPVRSWFP